MKGGTKTKNNAAMVIADAPARALIIFGDGLIGALSDSHTNLHRLAKDGSCGFLALRDIPSHRGRYSTILSFIQSKSFVEIHMRDQNSVTYGQNSVQIPVGLVMFFSII